MTGTATALCAAISIDTTDTQVPDWVHLLPIGDVRTADGRGPYRVGDIPALMAASMAGGKLVLDENHATDLAAPKGQSAPARGWIVELQQRADGVWGKVDWTTEGRAIVPGYRGISPAIVHRKDGTVLSIARASLTNTPNFRGLQSLHSKEVPMDFRAWLIEALGLAADASDDAIIAAMKKAMEGKPDEAAVETALQSAMSPIASALGLAATADAATVLAGVKQLQAGDDDRFTALQSELSTITTSFNTLQEETRRDKATAFVDGAIAAGRVGVKPQRDRYISMHMKNSADAEAIIGALPAVKTGATLTGEPAAAKDGLSAADETVISLMGLDRKAYAETLAAEGKVLA
ncbi:MAG: phage protease [Sphingomonas aquatilis]